MQLTWWQMTLSTWSRSQPSSRKKACQVRAPSSTPLVSTAGASVEVKWTY